MYLYRNAHYWRTEVSPTSVHFRCDIFATAGTGLMSGQDVQLHLHLQQEKTVFCLRNEP